jgi:hypothetical protein
VLNTAVNSNSSLIRILTKDILLLECNVLGLEPVTYGLEGRCSPTELLVLGLPSLHSPL